MRRGVMVGIVLGVLGLLGWLASRGLTESPVGTSRLPPPGPRPGEGWLLQALSQPAVPAAQAPSQSIRGRVVGPHGPVAGVELRASRAVPGESLSELPCEGPRGELTQVSSISCREPERLMELVARRQGEVAVLARALSDAEGTFVLEGLEAGTYSLWAEGAEGTAVLRDVEAGRQDVELKLGAGTRLTGSVTGEGGEPIPGALVTAIFEAHSRFFETLADGTGHFDLGVLPRGHYVLLSSREGWLTGQEWVTAYKSRMESRLILEQPRRVEGQVEREGRPVAGARVVLESSSGASRALLADATGHFVLEGLSRHHAYTLIATHEGLGARLPLNFRGPEGARSSFLAERVGISLELMPAAEVSGHVLDDARRPLAGARVTLEEKAEEGSSHVVARTRTDAEGRYALGPARPGPLRLEVEAEGWSVPGHGTWTDFPAGPSTRDVVMSPDSPIEGVLVDGSGQPVAHAKLEVTSLVEHEAWASCESGPDGHFLLNAPLPGNYQLRIDDERIREGSWTPGVVAPSHPRLVVALRPSVVGEVVDDKGEPVPDAEVSLWAEESARETSQSGPLPANARGPVWRPVSASGRSSRPTSGLSDAQGRFSLPSPSAGHYRLFAETQQEGLLYSTSQGVDVGEGETHVRVRFSPTHALSGVVVDAREQPLEGVRVSLEAAMHLVRGCGVGAPDWGVRTGADGRFSFEAVSGESLELSTFLPAHSLRQSVNDNPRDLLRLEPGTRDVRIVLIREAAVHGRLVQADGSPITEYRLNGLEQESESGEFSWPILGTGTLQLELSAPERPGLAGVRRSVPVQEEVDQDLGTIVLGGP